jgi:hypothetical protein
VEPPRRDRAAVDVGGEPDAPSARASTGAGRAAAHAAKPTPGAAAAEVAKPPPIRLDAVLGAR